MNGNINIDGSFVGTAEVKRTNNKLEVNFYDENIQIEYIGKDGRLKDGSFSEEYRLNKPNEFYLDIRQNIKNILEPDFYYSAFGLVYGNKIDLAVILKDDNFLNYLENQYIETIRIAFVLRDNMSGTSIKLRPDLIKTAFADDFSNSIFGTWGLVFLEYCECLLSGAGDELLYHAYLSKFQYLNLEDPTNRIAILNRFWWAVRLLLLNLRSGQDRLIKYQLENKTSES